jgi:hypothetical protein
MAGMWGTPGETLRRYAAFAGLTSRVGWAKAVAIRLVEGERVVRRAHQRN